MRTVIFRFGDFRLDPAARELWRGDERINLPPKSFDCLAYLVEHRERAVGRDELISAVWGRADVNDALLAQTLLRSRRAVGDTGGEQTAIRTVPRFGYRWVAPVECIDGGVPPVASAVAAPAVAAPADVAPPAAPRRTGSIVLASIAVLAITALAIVFVWHRGDAPPAPADARDLAVVLPVDIDETSADTAWIRLGVMDYLASRLRTDGKLAVVPSERVVAFGVATTAGEAERTKILRTIGASILVQPHARRTAQGWQLDLTWYAGTRRENATAQGATALAAAAIAADTLLARVGRREATAPAPPPTESSELVQRLDAAMLAGDLAAARSTLDAAPAALRADPDVRVRQAQIDFRAGRIDEADRAFGALRDHLTALPTAVQAQALMGLGAVAVRREDFPAAERRYAEALAALGPQAEAELIGNGYVGRGVARAALGRFDEALSDLGRARVALERAGDQPGAASVDTNRGLLESNRRRWRDAVEAFDRAIAVFERYDVPDNLAASLLGKARADLALIDIDAALADSARAWQIAGTLENGVLVDNVRHVRIHVLIAAGQLAAATALIEGDPETGAAHASQMLELRVRDALARGDAATAFADATRYAQERPGAEAELLLAVSAFAARQRAPEPATPSKDGDATAALARALRARGVGDADTAARAFADALAAANRDVTPDVRVDIAQFYIPFLLERREFDRASALGGDIAPYAVRDFRAARALARLYRALDDQVLLAQATARVTATAGERDPDKAIY